MIKRTTVKPQTAPYYSDMSIEKIEITPDELAKELISRNNSYGQASASIYSLAYSAIFKKYPALAKKHHQIGKDIYLGIDLVIVPMPNMPAPIHRPSKHLYEQEVVNTWKEYQTNPKYSFSFSFAYADLPGTLGLHRKDNQATNKQIVIKSTHRHKQKRQSRDNEPTILRTK